MLRGLIIAGAVTVGGLSVGVSGTNAAPVGASPQSSAMPHMTLIEKSQYRNYCRRWYRECRRRWGGGWDFRRCMRRHGCG